MSIVVPPDVYDCPPEQIPEQIAHLYREVQGVFVYSVNRTRAEMERISTFYLLRQGWEGTP